MKAHPLPAVDLFATARSAFEALVQQLRGALFAQGKHSRVEEHIHDQGNEVKRCLYQAYLKTRSNEDRRAAEVRAAAMGERVHSARRPIESIHGNVSLDRCAIDPGTGAGYRYPLDEALNIPAETYSLPLRQRVAEGARELSMEKTVKFIDRTTGAHVPKRQVEELTVRAAQDFDAYYAERE